MKRAVAIGCLTAILLTSIRGGTIDSIWIPIIFGLTGFLGTLLISYSVRSDPIENIEDSTAHSKVAGWVRVVLAFIIAASLVIWSGPLAFSAGYAGWLVALFLVITASLVVCLISAHWPIAFGILVATAIDVSIVLQNARWDRAHGNPRFWEEFRNGEYKGFLMIWMLLAGLSLTVSIPIYLKRLHRN
jgi:hypothetical protein